MLHEPRRNNGVCAWLAVLLFVVAGSAQEGRRFRYALPAEGLRYRLTVEYEKNLKLTGTGRDGRKESSTFQASATLDLEHSATPPAAGGTVYAVTWGPQTLVTRGLIEPENSSPPAEKKPAAEKEGRVELLVRIEDRELLLRRNGLVLLDTRADINAHRWARVFGDFALTAYDLRYELSDRGRMMEVAGAGKLLRILASRGGATLLLLFPEEAIAPEATWTATLTEPAIKDKGEKPSELDPEDEKKPAGPQPPPWEPTYKFLGWKEVGGRRCAQMEMRARRAYRQPPPERQEGQPSVDLAGTREGNYLFDPQLGALIQGVVREESTEVAAAGGWEKTDRRLAVTKLEYLGPVPPQKKAAEPPAEAREPGN